MASQCPECREADFTEAECTVGLCNDQCSACAEVAKSAGDLTPDDVFWRAVEATRGN